ncbi:hypothetical protein BSG1_10378 [Bacillus sp. SG-1]|nr:hypothetical protein BSG1_10378 [Bacillus sp. SG-1]
MKNTRPKKANIFSFLLIVSYNEGRRMRKGE